MTALLLVASLAYGQESVTYDRLFGPEADAPQAADAPPPAPELPVWAWPAALLAVGGAFALRWKVGRATAPAAPIRVLSRQPLGDRSALVLIDVEDADGERRRLLVGTGPGAPSLVADLGAVLPPAEAAPRNLAEPAPRNIAEEILAERGLLDREI